MQPILNVFFASSTGTPLKLLFSEDSWEVTARKTDVPESESGDMETSVRNFNANDLSREFQFCFVKGLEKGTFASGSWTGFDFRSARNENIWRKCR